MVIAKNKAIITCEMTLYTDIVRKDFHAYIMCDMCVFIYLPLLERAISAPDST